MNVGENDSFAYRNNKHVFPTPLGIIELKLMEVEREYVRIARKQKYEKYKETTMQMKGEQGCGTSCRRTGVSDHEELDLQIKGRISSCHRVQ